MAVPNPPTIELPPTPPQRSDPTNFPARGDAFMSWFVTAWNYLSTLVPWITARANEVWANADTVAANATYVASTANYKGLWTSLTGALNMPATVSHNGRFWQLNQNLANVTTAQPGVSAAWTDAVGTNVPTATIGDASTAIANTDFVQKTVGGVLNKSVAGGANVTLTATEAGYGTLNLTGAITANIDVIVPATPTRAWIVDNNTTGNFTLRVKTAAGVGVYIPRGRSAFTYSNGTDVQPGDDAYVENLGMRNRIINGGCQIAQRGQSLVVASGGTPQVYGGPDRFATQNFNAGGQFTQSQSDMVFQGVSKKAVRQTVNTANTSLTGANYWLGICQVIEGVNSFDLPGSPVALSFIFNTSVSGTFSVAVRDSLASQSYVTTFSAVANTPKKVVISIATIPLTVNIPNSNADGVRLTIGTLNTGALQTTQTNIWQVGNFLCAAGATNWGSAAGNFIELTELQFEKGPTDTPFEYRPYGMDLAQCQRYFWKSYGPNDAPGHGAGGGFSSLILGSANVIGYYMLGVCFPTTMRGVPTVTFYSIDANGTPGQWRNGSNSVSLPAQANGRNPTGFSIALNGTGYYTTHDAWYIHATASAEL